MRAVVRCCDRKTLMQPKGRTEADDGRRTVLHDLTMTGFVPIGRMPIVQYCNNSSKSYFAEKVWRKQRQNGKDALFF